jgi:hypothetical protein
MHDELTQADLVTGGDGTAEAAVRLDSAKTSRETLGASSKSLTSFERKPPREKSRPAGVAVVLVMMPITVTLARVAPTELPAPSGPGSDQ